MAIERRPWLLRYGGAVAAVALATWVRLLLGPTLGERSPYSTFIIAIAFTAWYGGLRASVLALVLSWAAAAYFIIRPRGALTAVATDRQVAFALFGMAGLAIILLGRAMRSAQHRAEVALEAEQVQRERLRVTLRSIADGIITTDEQGNVTGLNPVAERLTGWTDEAALGQPLRAVFRTLDDRTQRTAETPVDRIVSGGVEVLSRDHTVLVGRDGTTRPIEHSTAPLKEGRDKIIGIVITFRDVTERMLAERELRRSEERFRLLTEVMPQLVWSGLPDGSIDYCNSRWLAYTGFSSEQARGEGWAGAIHPDDREESARAWERAATAGLEYQVEQRLRGRGGGYRWFLTRAMPLRGEGGEVLRWYGTCTDIDDLKRTREALHQQIRIVQAITDNAAACLFMTDEEGRVTYMNPSAERITGWSFEEVRGKVLHDVTHHSRPDGSPYPLADCPLWQASRHGSALRGHEDVFFRKDGRSYPVVCAFAPILEGDRVRSALLEFRDVTEEKRAERALRDADRRKDEFLATLAHELRNPLAPIRNALHLLDSPETDGATREEIRAVLLRQVEHLTRLVDDLLDVSRITQGKVELRKEVVDLAALVERSVEASRPHLEDRGHTLSVSLPPEPVRLEADPTRLGQVLDNLLNNAAKYTDPGGRIVLSAAPRGKDVEVRVRDTGIGLAAEHLPHIFDLFMQAERRLDRSQGGLGIGLSLVRSLVEMHGGTVAAHSDGPGRGSEFVVRLPVLAPSADAQPRAEPAPRRRAGPSLPRRRILVVDDNLDSARTMALLLRRSWGQEVELAQDGPAAVEAANAFRPEVILLDIGLPGMNGYEVARTLRGRPEFAATVIVAMTGWGQEEDRRRSREAGFDHHLVKPLDPEDLRSLLASLDGEAAEV